jgi:O-antigen ligase
VNEIVSSGVLAQMDAPWAKSLDSVLQSVWTLIPAFVTGEVTEQLERLRNVSAQSRLDSWAEGLRFLVRHPFGGGPGAMLDNTRAMLQFAPIDVGILRYGLELGWPGLIGLVGMWFAVFWAGLRKMLRAAHPDTRLLGRYLLALWLAVGVAQSITSFLHTEMLSIMVWSFGGILLNLDRISNRQASAFGADGVAVQS